MCNKRLIKKLEAVTQRITAIPNNSPPKTALVIRTTDKTLQAALELVGLKYVDAEGGQ